MTPVVFFARTKAESMLLHVLPEQIQTDSFGRQSRTPAVLAAFERGTYQTSDPSIIDAIRKSPAYAQGEVFEALTDADKKAFEAHLRANRPGVVRGAIGTEAFEKEMGQAAKKDEPAKGGPNMLSAVTKCDVCGKEFPDDLGGKKLRMHKVSHRSSLNDVLGD